MGQSHSDAGGSPSDPPKKRIVFDPLRRGRGSSSTRETNIPLSGAQIDTSFQSTVARRMQPRQERITGNLEAPNENIRSKLEEIRKKHAWLSKKTGAGIEDLDNQKCLDLVFKEAAKALRKNDEAKLNEIDQDFGAQVEHEMISRIKDEHKWLITNALGMVDKEYIDNKLNKAKSAFEDGDNTDLLRSIYKEFKYYKKNATASQYMSGISKKSTEATQRYTQRSALENYREQGSHPSTIKEGSERSSDREKGILGKQSKIPSSDTSGPQQDKEKYLSRSRSYIGLGPDTTSDKTLTEQYNFLLPSVRFQYLDRIVNSNKKIILIDSSNIPSQPVYYDNLSHKIYIPINTENDIVRPIEDIRDNLLWEMYNASMRGPFQRLDDQRYVYEANKNSSYEEKEIYPYKIAAYALSYEWYEWINIIEHYLHCQAINTDPNMGEKGPHIKNNLSHASNSDDKTWGEWDNFPNYLQEQIKNGHTTNIDPQALDPSWKGKHLLAMVERKYPASLIITQKQIRNWENGRTRKIKRPSNNPFISLTIIKQVQEHAKLHIKVESDSSN
jgi:hypothetical protein